MVEIGDLSENMKVRSRDGAEIGTVIRLEAGGMLVEKGISLLRDLLVPVALVTHVHDGVAYLSLTRDELHARRDTGALGADLADRSLREETSRFVHEGEEVGAGGARTADNVPEGDEGRGSER